MSSPSGAARFTIPSQEFEPAYLELHRSGELQTRADRAVALLAECRLCPRDCGVDRLADKTAACKSGRYAQVSSFFPHFGEEDCLRGWNGSGTIFFTSCNLRCVFCQNFDISQEKAGVEAGPFQLAAMMLELQSQSCHNINFVTPEHVVPQILEALPLAISAGLRIPLVYNTSAYDSMESLALLDGIVDIYMPDFKIWGDSQSRRYLLARDYPTAARAAIQEMHRQVGPLKMDENGIAQRGVLLRHLVMPGDVAGSAAIMHFLANSVSKDTYINIMAQYRPAGKVNANNYPEINQPIKNDEVSVVVNAAESAGLWRFDRRRSIALRRI